MEEHRTEIYKLVEATTPMRRDIWDSAEAASKWMKSRVPWKTWDPRVFEIYVVCTFLILRAMTRPTLFFDSRNTGYSPYRHLTTPITTPA